MNENYLVTQANNLIEARHNKPLTAREQKIVLTMVGGIEPQDEDFKDYLISLKSFSEMLGLAGSTKYTEIKEIMKSLMEKTVEIPSENGGWILTHWVSSAEYVNGEGIIKLSFSPKLKPYLLQLKNQFTSYRLSNVLSLNSTYSIRLYELMKKWQHLGKWENSVEELKLKFGVTKESYQRYNHFKTRVILRAVEEVNEKTDLFIDFKEIKKGRGVDRIEFTIRHAPEKEIKLTESKKQTKNEDIRERLNLITEGYNFDLPFFTQMYQGASLIWNDAAENELQMLIRYVNQETTVKNPLGFIKSKIKTAWDIHQDGFPITFADLKVSKRPTGRTEVVPDWFNERNTSKEETVATVVTEEYQEKKRALLESLGKSPEEIEEEMNG
ncbi:MAG: replication initiation protein [Bacteroidetes bacterium]|nr:replication initiation protein [Bacteroidota bacterium]